MHWSIVVLHILVVAVISNDSFPIDLKEIDNDDIYLVDKERRGRFIQVNQTTLLPNPIELIRAKKSSSHNEEKLDERSAIPLIADDFKIEDKIPPTSTDEMDPREEQPYNGGVPMAQNNYTCADSLFEPQTFGYPSFFEDHFINRVHQPHFSNSMKMLTHHDCCNVDQLMGTFSGNFPCIDEYYLPEENLFC